LTLAVIVFATAAIMLAGHQRSQPIVEELRAQGLLVEQAPGVERTRTIPSSRLMCMRRWYGECHAHEPGVTNYGDRWVAYDLLGISKIEIEVDADPSGAETKLRAWARSICDSQPRQLYLRSFEPPMVFSDVARMVESECPSLEVLDYHYYYAVPIL
jgi:hypothetical protein